MADKDQKPESDPKLRDEVLKRMLKMPPKPHKPQPKVRAGKRKRAKPGIERE